MTHPALELLNIERAETDTVKAEILFAILKFAHSVKDELLREETIKLMPKASPWNPNKEWFEFYKDYFLMYADPDDGVDPDEWHRYGVEYWQLLTDEERNLRLADPAMGKGDGRKDAEGLNEA